MLLNDRALRLADAFATHAARLRVQVTRLSNGTRLIDCGVQAAGSIQAGIGLAKVCLADLAEVTVVPGGGSAISVPTIQVHTDWPLHACMASQYAGWQINNSGYFAMGSGPMRALAAREPLFQQLGLREQANAAVGVLEAGQLPSEEVARQIAGKCGISADQLTLLVAPITSLAGMIQVVARSVETALHKLHTLGFDLKKIQAAHGIAPLPPLHPRTVAALGRANEAILYGGRVTLWVRADTAELERLGPKLPSSASADHGAPFAVIFERYQRDFYKIDPLLFSPAEVTVINANTGQVSVWGRTDPELLQRSWFDVSL